MIDTSDWKRCPFCAGRFDGTDPRIHVNAIEGGKGAPKVFYMLSCCCGYNSKLYEDILDLKEWWNTRGGQEKGKPRPQMRVRHNRRVVDPTAEAARKRAASASDEEFGPLSRDD